MPSSARSLLTTEPMAGRSPFRKPVYSSGAVWPCCWNFMLRMMASLSAIFACNGISSQMSMPGTFVLIGLNSPRYSTGALGFRSYRSMWLGPPLR